MKRIVARGSGGFTLLELLMVLLLISLATVLVYPNLRPRLERTRREASLRKISATLDDLRRRAVVDGTVLVLAFDKGGRRILLGAEGEQKEPQEMEFPEGMEIFSMDPELLYYFPQGHSSGAVLEAGSDPERLARIEVGSFTGLSRVVPAEAE